MPSFLAISSTLSRTGLRVNSKQVKFAQKLSSIVGVVILRYRDIAKEAEVGIACKERNREKHLCLSGSH